ncbi:unnamed protein product [Brassica oleracea var. botrytis]
METQNSSLNLFSKLSPPPESLLTTSPPERRMRVTRRFWWICFLWVLENPAPANLMLISGDGDFSYALNRLRMLRYNILLAHPLQASPFLVASARTSWMWRSLIATRSCCSFGSEHALSTQAMDSGCAFNKADKLKGIYVQKAASQQETRRKKLHKEWRVCNVACKSTDIFTTAREQAAQLKQNLELLGEPGNIASASSGCHEQDTEIMMVEMTLDTDALIDARECVQDNDSQSRDAFMKCLETEQGTDGDYCNI